MTVSRWLLAAALLLSPPAWAADADADGIPDDVEITEGRDPGVKDNDLFTVARLFAMQQYRDFLSREGDAGGITFYTDHINGGTLSRAQTIENFFNSPEFSGTVSPIARLYFATFLRIPDYAGLIFQVDAYRTGTPLAVIANNFTLSPEFQATYGALNNQAFVALLYQNILGRTASQPEIDFHVARLLAGETRGAVLTGFSESPEYRQLTANDVYVTMMYVGMLRRAPEQAGFDFWVDYMTDGNSGQALIMGFLNAPEYRNRFMALPVTLTVQKTGTGTGTVSTTPAGIDCGATCSATFLTGQQVSVSAMATGGAIFDGWGGACTGAGSCMVTMDAAKTVIADFSPAPLGVGEACMTTPQCAGGLSCVDGVCCTGACNGTCEKCNLAGSLGTCTAVADGADPDNECGAVSCTGYYHGWLGDSCRAKADVSAAQAMCNGARACRSQAQVCNAQTAAGPTTTTCDSFCQNPNLGTTCTGTIAGTCANVNQGNQTCGFGVCTVTVPRCINGAPNNCVPNSGAASAETCDDLDNNCDNIVDNNPAFADSLEPNFDCSTVKTLPPVSSDQTLTHTATLYPAGDVDYFRIVSNETDNSCACCDFFCTDEDYILTISLTVPAGAGSYLFCTHGSACGSVAANCQTVLAGGTATWTYNLDGGCPGNDSYSTFVRVSAGGSAPGFECRAYTLTYSFNALVCNSGSESKLRAQGGTVIEPLQSLPLPKEPEPAPAGE